MAFGISSYSDLGEIRKAIDFLKQSLAIGEAIENPRIISLCEQKLKELEEADPTFRFLVDYMEKLLYLLHKIQ